MRECVGLGNALSFGTSGCICSLEIAEVRHANRSPSRAATSGDSQNHPNSPPTLHLSNIRLDHD